MSLEPDEQELARDLESLTAGVSERFARCPEPAVIQAAIASVLPDGPGAQVRAHVEACPMCKLLIHDLALLDQAPLPERDANRIWARIESGIASKTPSSQPAGAATKWWTPLFRPWAIATAAMAVILLAISVSVSIRLMRAPRDNSEASNRLPEATPGDSPAATNPAQSIPSPEAASAFRLEKAPVRLPASAAMVWRGGADADADRASAQLKELEGALVPYRAGNYAEAELRLKRLAEKYPRSAEARFYLGVSQLFLNKDQEAVASLKAARSLAAQVLAGEAAWYLAMAYHTVGQDREARPLLEKLCGSGGKDSTRACPALGELSKVQ
jgi:TolA-binding protein